MAKAFKHLSDREILALAISLEEDDSRIYADFADALKDQYPTTAEMFERMRLEEVGHRDALFARYRERFGEHIPLIRRDDVRGFAKRKAMWLKRPLGPDAARKQAELMELETRRYYEAAAARTTDANTRQLLLDLAEEERKHSNVAEKFEAEHVTPHVKEDEEKTRRRSFILEIVQPGLAGLMDGSVSTLAPLFAAAFAAHKHGDPFANRDTFLVGLAAAVGAGISMGFAEGLSDDGQLSGRGRPLIRGTVCGLMTALGGIGHTLPFLVPDATPNAFHIATTIAIAIVLVELLVIAWIRKRYMDTPLLTAAFQVIVGGLLVFAAGILIGNS